MVEYHETPKIPKKRKRIRKHIPHNQRSSTFVCKRNGRERARVENLNQAFDVLRQHIPSIKTERTLPKMTIIQEATDYINSLYAVLGEGCDSGRNTASCEDNVCGTGSGRNTASCEDNVCGTGSDASDSSFENSTSSSDAPSLDSVHLSRVLANLQCSPLSDVKSEPCSEGKCCDGTSASPPDDRTVDDLCVYDDVVIMWLHKHNFIRDIPDREFS